MKYKLLCIDVDGTLASDDKSISNENINALKKAHQAGVKIAIASGRTPNSLNDIFKRIGVSPLLICLNGAYLEDNGKAISIHSLSKEQLEKAYHIISDNQTSAAFSTPQYSIRNSDVSPAWKKQLAKGSLKADYIVAKDQENYRKIIFDNANDIVKISILEKDAMKYEKIRNEFEELGIFAVAKSDVDYVDVTDLGVNKGSAVKELAQYLGIDLSNIACIGDNENDKEMLQVSGLSIAMKNANDNIKDLADIISDDDNNHHGVAGVIERYILEFEERV